MARVMVFQHVAAEPLGTLDPMLRRRGHRLRFYNFHRHPGAHPNVDRYGALIVLGGPMNVADREKLPHLDREIEAIRKAVEQGKPVLGICLGAQLLAEAFGGRVFQSPQWEIGWYPVATTDAGREDPVTAALAPEMPVFQWHGCTFDPPTDAALLATGEGCRHQAFRLGDHAYGFQFHLEMDAPLIDRWLRLPHYREELAASGVDDDEAAIRAQTTRHLAPLQQTAAQVFNAFLDKLGPTRSRVVLPSR